jgi:hypothetical protein
MSKWSTSTAYAALFIGLGGFVLAILAILAKSPLAAIAWVGTAGLGAYAMNAWSVYFRDKEAAEAATPPVVVVNSQQPVTVN